MHQPREILCSSYSSSQRTHFIANAGVASYIIFKRNKRTFEVHPTVEKLKQREMYESAAYTNGKTCQPSVVSEKKKHFVYNGQLYVNTTHLR